MRPYLSSCEITVYALSSEDAEVKVEQALRGVEGFDDVLFDSTNPLDPEEYEPEEEK